MKRVKVLRTFFLLASVLTFIVPEVSAAGISAQEYNHRGLEFLRHNKYATAEVNFQKAAELAPAVKYYHNNCAVACIKQKKYTKAVHHLEACLAVDPNYPKALYNMAVASFYLKRYKTAYNYYRLAKSSDNDYAELRFKKDKVIRILKKKSQQEPEDSDLSLILKYLKEN